MNVLILMKINGSSDVDQFVITIRAHTSNSARYCDIVHARIRETEGGQVNCALKSELNERIRS